MRRLGYVATSQEMSEPKKEGSKASKKEAYNKYFSSLFKGSMAQPTF